MSVVNYCKLSFFEFPGHVEGCEWNTVRGNPVRPERDQMTGDQTKKSRFEKDTDPHIALAALQKSGGDPKKVPGGGTHALPENLRKVVEDLDSRAETMALIQKGEMDKAEERLKSVLKENPQENYALYYLGVLAFRVEDYSKAFDYFKRVITAMRARCRAVPQSAFLPLQLGKACLLAAISQIRLGSGGEAHSLLQEALLHLERAKQNAIEFHIYKKMKKNFDESLSLTETLSKNPSAKIDLSNLDLMDY